MGSGLRVLVATRHRLVAEAIVAALKQLGIGGEVAGGVGEVRRKAAGGEVDLAVLGVDLTDDGLPWTGQLGVPLVILTEGRAADGYVGDAVRAGVRGWVPDDSSVQHLSNVIHGVARGESWFPPALLTRILSDLTSLQGELGQDAERIATLTVREREVLDYLCAGMTRPMIARHLYLSPHTVRTHVQNIMDKLDVHSSLAAVALARRVGIRGRTLPQSR